MGAAPTGLRQALVLAVALGALTTATGTAKAGVWTVEKASNGPSGMWAVGVTQRFVASVGSQLVETARTGGINTFALGPKLSLRQKQRLRSIAHQSDLRVINLRHRPCTNPTGSCAVLARRPAQIKKLLRKRHVDIVVVRGLHANDVVRLARQHGQLVQRNSSAKLLFLMRPSPRLDRKAWREAIAAAADLRRVGLGVQPVTQTGKKAVRLFLSVLSAPVSSPPSPPSSPPPPPPAQAPPSPEGSTWLRGDFETGDHSQWSWGAQCANTGVPSAGSVVRGTISVQSEVVAQGVFAARFDLPAASAKNACETLAKRQIGVGTDDFYALMVRFPAEWREPSPARWGLSLAQLNFQNIWGAPISLAAHGDHVALTIATGQCNGFETSTPGCAYSSGRNGNVAPMSAVPAPMALEVWHQLIVRVRWANDSSGIIEVWHRLQGDESWDKTVSLSGYPTVQWRSGQGRDSIIGSTTSDKIGAYRGAADFPLTVWHDGFVRTTTFTAAEAAQD